MPADFLALPIPHKLPLTRFVELFRQRNDDPRSLLFAVLGVLHGEDQLATAARCASWEQSRGTVTAENIAAWVAELPEAKTLIMDLPGARSALQLFCISTIEEAAAVKLPRDFN